MLKVRFKYTGEIKEVTNNEALGLVETGEAIVYHGKMMAGSTSKKYKTKGK